MTTREKTLELLMASGSNYISGQEIAGRLYVTRAAVWKAIKTLQKEGYNIEAVTNRGYRLRLNSSIPSYGMIKEELSSYEALTSIPDVTIIEETESTNDLARAYAEEHPREEHIFIADSQTRGRGRKGRDFYSPSGTGLYMSILIYPEVTLDRAMNYTCMMASCVCRAIEKVTGLSAGIKWVNDIYLDEHKIAGILTEATTSIEDGSLNYVIIGIGINVYTPYDGFPKDIEDRAGALLTDRLEEDARSMLAAAVIGEFYLSYRLPDSHPYAEDYRKRSMLIGSYIKIMPRNDGRNEYAYVTGVDDECHLLVRYDDGREDLLYSGEVSVVRY